MTSERATSDDDQNLIHALELDALAHDAAAGRPNVPAWALSTFGPSREPQVHEVGATMISEDYKISCDWCGRYIKLQDIATGKADHAFVLPDSEFSRETFESKCARCKAKHAELAPT
jgi:hypothetical protein